MRGCERSIIVSKYFVGRNDKIALNNLQHTLFGIRALLSYYLSMDMPHSNIPSTSPTRQNANYFPQSYKCHLEVSHSGNRCHICIERIAYPHCPESWRDGKRIPCGFHRNHLSTNM
ncbi:hypothetical protein CDAR_190481 [Caerostris darwini]|uniref:Uncharacterized protein n=1 Tax=Caerostris darwini TaxID=1538125 RepID=A0AAV4MN41_9ARAC|nr:hypothetical protein CDAR_190481 [Caerostris darwini]